jgi:hypothetical protein
MAVLQLMSIFQMRMILAHYYTKIVRIRRLALVAYFIVLMMGMLRRLWFGIILILNQGIGAVALILIAG